MKTELSLRANTIKTQAYCPYSKFQVGACILSDTNNYYSGCNIESSSYGATICAEACAISQMIASGDKYIKEIAISASSNQICYPCGICLQRISEFASSSTFIHICIKDEIKQSLKLDQMLPYRFDNSVLITI